MKIGIDNCKLNDVKADFTQGIIGNHRDDWPAVRQIKVPDFVLEKNIEYIDILHSDIQGCELGLLQDITPLLNEKRIKYLFISTHSDDLHYNCLDALKKCNYRIIASADFETETFCYDGIIVACPKDIQTIKYTSLGCRKTTPLRNKPFEIVYQNEALSDKGLI